MASVELRNLTKRYDAVAVVDDVSLRIDHGLLVCLLGPSGCGKTTTLRLIAGFVEPTAGEIAVGDRVVSSPARTLPPEARKMSMIFQSYALWPHMTVAENVAYGLTLAQAAARRDRREGHGASSPPRKLADLAARYPGELSGGQQQRVALARALVVEPETLLLDEPLSNLDANLREEMRFEVRRLHDEYRYTTVYVTHDQSEAMTTADLIAVMNGGTDRAARPAGGNLCAAALGVRRPLHRRQQHPQGQGARRRPRRDRRGRRRLHRRRRWCRAPMPRSRSASTKSASERSGTEPVRENVIPRRGGAQRLSRQQPRLYGRRSATARSFASSPRRSTTSRRAAGSGCSLPPERCRVLER